MKQLKNLVIASALCVGMNSCCGNKNEIPPADLGRKDRSDV